MLLENLIKIRKLAKFIGSFVSTFPASKYRQLHFRRLENFKTRALVTYKGNYEALISISSECKEEIKWWENNILNMYKPINLPKVKYEIHCDALNLGWGAVFNNKIKIWGHWTKNERSLYINALEMKAIYNGLKYFQKSLSTFHVSFLR